MDKHRKQTTSRRVWVAMGRFFTGASRLHRKAAFKTQSLQPPREPYENGACKLQIIDSSAPIHAIKTMQRNKKKTTSCFVGCTDGSKAPPFSTTGWYPALNGFRVRGLISVGSDLFYWHYRWICGVHKIGTIRPIIQAEPVVPPTLMDVPCYDQARKSREKVRFSYPKRRCNKILHLLKKEDRVTTWAILGFRRDTPRSDQ